MFLYILPKCKSQEKHRLFYVKCSRNLKESHFYKHAGCIVLTCPYVNHVIKSVKLINNINNLCDKTIHDCSTVNSTELDSPTINSN